MGKQRKVEPSLDELNIKRPFCRISGKIGVSAHNKALRAALVARDGTMCWICKYETPAWDRTIDHILPVSLGGESVLGNLKLAHGRCNAFRSDDVHLTAEELVEKMNRPDRKALRAHLRAQWKARMLEQQEKSQIEMVG